MEATNKIDYKIAKVPTRAVALFPNRAQVSREINGIQLKSGINEVTITGLSPTLDEDSIKVEGTGSAIITDISVEALPNQDNFQDVYPDEDSSDNDESEGEEDPEPEDLRAARIRVTELEDDMLIVQDALDSVDQRQQILDARSDGPDTTEQDKCARLTELLAAYRSERAALFREQITARQSQRLAQEALDAAIARLHTLQCAALKESRESRNARRRRREADQRRRADRREERERVRQERVKFWPKHCYSVKVTLEVSAMTPMSSRRQSVASETEIVRPVTSSGTDTTTLPDNGISCSLRLSYVTSAAGWAPSYDLQLSTAAGAPATLCFDAKVSNRTSETWRDCRVSLSTSDAVLAAADAALPELEPWRIRLAGKDGHRPTAAGEDHITISRREENEAVAFALARRKRVTEGKPRGDMFGLPSQYSDVEPTCHPEAYGAVSSAIDDGTDMRRAAPKKKRTQRQQQPPQIRARMPMALCAVAPGAAPTSPPPLENEVAVVDFEDSLVEEAGMATSYDLPGPRTLAPKSASSKQRVARVALPSATLSHVVVAKYRPAAYLQARLRNGSRLALLPGTAGLTLDGGFLGRAALPRCGAGDAFTVNLGVDPAVRVSYARPEVRRAATGMFSKENSSVFARAIVLHNTRGSGQPARLRVLDQVPVSEDERLRVEVVTPRGLAVDGPAVVTGAPGREEDAMDREWGRATAQMSKTGEISWDVRLNPGKMVKLWLEYAVWSPTNDIAVEC